jgi:cytoskeletal protein CcmA (bactofilin family)
MLSNFGKKPEQEASAAPAPQTSAFGSAPAGASAAAAARPSVSRSAADRGAPSVIGPDLTIMGNLISSGEVQGDLHGTHIVIGERAKITGGVNAEEVVVRGHVMGSIRGRKVMLQSSSHVEGDVHHQSLAIEQGAYFEGKSRRSDDPLAGVQRPQPGANGAA